MSNKTISINPSLFGIGGTKTKKNRANPSKPIVTPLISPNLLKNKLLKRIKEHKIRETETLTNNKKKLPDINSEYLNKPQPNNSYNTNISYNDEFNDTISYLQTLSKQKKINDEKAKYERNKQKKIEELERKTVKNYQSMTMPHVNIDLPEELRHPLITVNTEQFSLGSTPPITLSQYNKDQLPYGILKGGSKPTYRDWNKSQRSLIVTNPEASLIIQGGVTKQNIERENRLNNLREKLKNKQLSNENHDQVNTLMMTQNLIQKPKQEIEHFENENVHLNPIISQLPQMPSLIGTKQPNVNTYSNLNSIPESVKIKKITKRTIKRKYTLGKSKIKKSVAVLLKDRATRKNVLIAQRDLKRKSINDIKSYLRDHNLIKIGSNAPNDVVRKLYESAMLAGEITNNNTDTLLHNLMKDDMGN